MSLLEFLSICFMFILGSADAAKAIYEEIRESDGRKISEKLLHQTAFIHKSFHECSLKSICKYVINDMSNGKFTIYNSEYKLPLKKKGLRIWKKLYQASSNYCQDAYNKRFVRDNIVMIDIPVVGPSKVRCDMATQPGGWIIFQRRVDATVDFYLTWADYRGGFGDLHGNFWLGLEKLHRLAAPGKGAKLRVDIKHVDHPSEIRFAEYSLFEISNEANGYRLAVGGYSGNAGDALSYHNNKMFTTRDHDNDSSASNCAISHKGAWWYSDCINSNLNGVFPRDSRDDSTLISWLCCSKSQYGGIIFTEMKLWV